MVLLDWIVMGLTLFAIVAYGVWKTRSVNTAESYLLGDRDLRWWTIGLSIMATQASAITFLSTPGQAFDSGMGFAQFYFGLPLAMVLLSIFVLPIYYRLKVYTAYEYLEGRFDLRARTLTAGLFLLQRGLAAGITIYAPSIILSTILGWNLSATLLIVGGLVIMYTVAGGTKAVSVTQKQQMIVILTGMCLAAIFLVYQLPEGIGFTDSLNVAGKLGKLDLVDFEFDMSSRYNIWSGLLAGLFLFMSYFGTDQSQVQRYLSGRSLAESRLGLLFNGIIKVPMQVLVLFVGVMVFVFFQFAKPPIHFNTANVAAIEQSAMAGDFASAKTRYDAIHAEKVGAVTLLAQNLREGTSFDESLVTVENLQAQEKAVREEVDAIITSVDPGLETRDEDYIFISYILNYLPIGLVGLLIAVILSAAMSSSASELNALATTTVVDVYKRRIKQDGDDAHYLKASKWLTVMWGLIALTFAAGASLFDNLIEAVNIIGSLFYGAILGIFVVAFFLKKIGGRAVFYGALVAEFFVVTVYFLNYYEFINFTYLWLNPLGCIVCVLFAWFFQATLGDSDEKLVLEA
ncbi:MAG: sodium:solute symporter [Saprospiraceae bacterium]